MFTGRREEERTLKMTRDWSHAKKTFRKFLLNNYLTFYGKNLLGIGSIIGTKT